MTTTAVITKRKMRVMRALTQVENMGRGGGASNNLNALRAYTATVPMTQYDVPEVS